MVVAGILVLLLGTGFIIVALVVLAWRLSNRQLLHRLRAAPRVSSVQLSAAGRLPRSVLISGVTAIGAGGVLTSPAYHRDCLWYRTDVIGVDDDSVPAEELRSNAPTVFRRSAGGPITLRDPTGTALVDVKLILAGGAKQAIITNKTEDARLSVTHRADPGSGMMKLEEAGLLPGTASGVLARRWLNLREDTIEAGREVTVLGRPQRGSGSAVVLVRPGAVSADGPDAWIERLETVIAADAVLLRLLPVGLVVGGVGVALMVVGVR